jgi:hypothetical protein
MKEEKLIRPMRTGSEKLVASLAVGISSPVAKELKKLPDGTRVANNLWEYVWQALKHKDSSSYCSHS